MLQQPTKEKLYALRLHGMIEAIERQEQDEAARELGFLDRLALLIDQQWDWRENQTLTRRVKASRLRGAACVEDIDYRLEREGLCPCKFSSTANLRTTSNWNWPGRLHTKPKLLLLAEPAWKG
jgi:IstB-like ATP binding protein